MMSEIPIQIRLSFGKRLMTEEALEVVDVPVIFPRIHGHRVKTISPSLRTRRGIDNRGSNDGGPGCRKLPATQRCPAWPRPCPIPSMVHELRFQCMKEAFNDGIVPAVGASAHTDCDALGREPRAVGGGGVLRPAVGMMQESFRGLSVPQRHRQRFMGQRLREPTAHRPGNGPARVQIQHNGQIQPALLGPDIGDVPRPDPIRRGHGKLTIERVRGHGMRMSRIRRGPPLLHHLGADGVRPHEPRDPVFTDPVSVRSERRMDPGAPVRLPRLGMNHSDRGHQLPILRSAMTLPVNHQPELTLLF